MDNFVDYVKICVRSGKGGPGSTHLRREKCVPKGGPDGGDGGRGGDIILRGNKQLWTLLHLKYRKHVIAKDGEGGSGSLCSGKEGGDEYLDVPLGTIVKDVETGAFLAEISNEGQEYIIAKGGRGGLGNFHFRTSTFQTPRYSQPGEEGVNEWKILELKVLADVGLVGFPNAGKSTLLSVLSAAKPEIANYPFTTLTPQLGIVKYYDYKSFIMADIPGIIEGASEGKGLGLRFLRHIERNSTLLFLVNADSKDIFEEYKILLNELKKYNPELLDKKRILGISKSDLVDKELEDMISKDLNKRMRGKNRIPYVFFSAHGKKNLQEVKDLIWEQIKN